MNIPGKLTNQHQKKAETQLTKQNKTSLESVLKGDTTEPLAREWQHKRYSYTSSKILYVGGTALRSLYMTGKYLLFVYTFWMSMMLINFLT